MGGQADGSRCGRRFCLKSVVVGGFAKGVVATRYFVEEKGRDRWEYPQSYEKGAFRWHYMITVVL